MSVIFQVSLPFPWGRATGRDLSPFFRRGNLVKWFGRGHATQGHMQRMTSPAAMASPGGVWGVESDSPGLPASTPHCLAVDLGRVTAIF